MANQVLRRCVGCGVMAEKATLVRLSSSKGGGYAVMRDSLAYRDGRSAYIHTDEKCFAAAQKKNSFARSLKKPVPPDIIDEIFNIIEN